MRQRLTRFVLVLFVLAGCQPLAAIAQSSLAGADATNAWRQQVEAWRTHYEHEISAPDGWLTLVGLEWLKAGVNTFGAADDNTIPIHAQAPARMGMLTVMGKTVQLLAPTGGFPEGMQLDGAPAREGALRVSNSNPSTIAWKGLTLVVLPRGDRFVLRIKDADAPTRIAFHGLHWYAPDPRYRVTARWIPYKPPQVEPIPTVIGTTLNMIAPGVAEFLLNGNVVLLEPVLEGPDKSKLFFILRDTTSKTTTYGGGRFLTTGLPDRGLDQPGNLTLDFNELYNPPCAYTSFATCPLPPHKNDLPVPIEAGEQRYLP